MGTRTRNVLENIVLAAIILVLLQTLFEDLAVVLDWSISVRRVLLILGFFFDLFFTVEFVVRSYEAWRYGRLGNYFWYERGWIDLLASIPLLLLNSGPAVLAILAGGVSVVGVAGMLNVLKVVKAIRIARVLRLLRVLKIFRRIKNAESVMAQRHVAMISATTVSVFVLVLLAATMVEAFVSAPSLDARYQQHSFDMIELISSDQMRRAPALRTSLLKMDSAVLLVRDSGSVVFSRHPDSYYLRHFGPGDYGYIEARGVELFVDLRPINQEQSATNIRYFVVIIAIVLIYMFVYSPHFAMTVSDPIHIMRRGMSEKAYNLEVIVPGQYRHDDVYELSKLYNEVFLPMKDRSSGEETEVSALKMDDLKDMFE